MLGPAGEAMRQRNYGEDTAREIDCAVRTLVLTSFQRAKAVLEENRAILEASAKRLLEKETLDTTDLEQLFKPIKAAPTTFAPADPPCGKQTSSPGSLKSQS